jgi:hypothetical protein
MIEIIGEEGTGEYEAAVAISDALAKLWPGLKESPAELEHVKIAPNAKLAGYKVSDVDIVVAGVFAKPRYFVPRKALHDQDGKRLGGIKVKVENLVVAVEVKGHDAGGINVAGDEVTVRYPEGWKSATGQNIDQVHALAKYFEHQHLSTWVYRCVALQGIPALPISNGKSVPEAGAVAFGFSGSDFLTAVAGVNGVRKFGRDFALSSIPMAKARKVLEASIFRAIVPSKLDRAKMDRIAARRSEAKDLAELLGQQMVRLQGHGGTGKTIMLLQAAHEAFVGHGRRCIVLTYNVALAADITRLLALLRIPGASDGGGVEVKTVMSYVYTWLNRLGLEDEEAEDDFASYVSKCATALEWIDTGTVSASDISKAKDAEQSLLDFDVVLVDEGQDWPQAEADLLTRLYNPSTILVADGLDQLVRGERTNWHAAAGGKDKVSEKSLARCLRMKRNLGVFANAMAEEAGLNWSIEPSNEAAGGKVLLSYRPYTELGAMRQALLVEAQATGNSLIDFLHCVPTSEVVGTEDGPRSNLANQFELEGLATWDAVNQAARKDFPRSLDTARIVQYESCRGLEGWVTVLDGLDEFWHRKFEASLRQDDFNQSFVDPNERASRVAWRWVMIALTRPIDTLVITVRDPQSEVAKVIEAVAKSHSDFVQRID